MSRPTIDRFIDTLVLVLGIVCRAVLAALVGTAVSLLARPVRRVRRPALLATVG
jgi:hypothetical protein